MPSYADMEFNSGPKVQEAIFYASYFFFIFSTVMINEIKSENGQNPYRLSSSFSFCVFSQAGKTQILLNGTAQN
jgi:hypothetical protein